MATYNKRGYKSKDKRNQDVIAQEESTTAEVFSTLDEGAGKTEAWVSTNQNIILGVIAVIAIGVLGYLGYEQFIQKPKEASAANELFYPQQYFDQAVNAVEGREDLFTTALEGADGKYGLLDIISQYPGTKAANLAEYEAGIAYLNLSQYRDAVAHLEAFSSDDVILGALAKGAIGDAFMELDQPADALTYYNEAISHSNNEFSTPQFLLKAAVASMSLNDNSKARGFFETLKNDFPNSPEASQVDAYLGMLE
jgi:TolA-binding protein